MRWSVLLLACSLGAQVYSPKVLLKGQPDTSSLSALTRSVLEQARAHTPREKAEAIWRFFLTDGRFVEPGMIYHIAGWAYEEPTGEVLDPVKLLNSYGFGLCYHVAPLLESAFKAGGFADARVWFLTGHTVAEVLYDGGYHYFDSAMMGYSVIGTSGPLKDRPVASVHQIEQDGTIVTGKLAGPKQADTANVDSPWYPADVRAHAIGDLARLFTTSDDNWLYPYQRFSSGHSMDFVLCPGEKMVRYFKPERQGLYYLPYRFDGAMWPEFPEESEQYKIRTVDGPKSQKDARTWATGVQEYRPPRSGERKALYRMPCPYVIIDASFQMVAELADAGQSIAVETSVDDGRPWIAAGALSGPHRGGWTVQPAILTKSEHGSRNAVSGTYGYLVRVNQTGGAPRDLVLTTRFQFNPRTLPKLRPGPNELEYRSSNSERWEIVPAPVRLNGVVPVTNGGQSYLANSGDAAGDVVFELQAPDGGEFTDFDAGARFLDLRDGLAPDKFTAEVRHVMPWPSAGNVLAASLAWSASAEGPFKILWEYAPKMKWRDGKEIYRTLRWPEVDRSVRQLPKGTRRVYVRYRLQGLAMDSARMAVVREGVVSGPLRITHVWTEEGKRQERALQVEEKTKSYQINLAPGSAPVNEALIFESKQ